MVLFVLSTCSNLYGHGQGDVPGRQRPIHPGLATFHDGSEDRGLEQRTACGMDMWYVPRHCMAVWSHSGMAWCTVGSYARACVCVGYRGQVGGDSCVHP